MSTTQNERTLNALRELTLRTEQHLAGALVTFPASLLPQCKAIIAEAESQQKITVDNQPPPDRMQPR